MRSSSTPLSSALTRVEPHMLFVDDDGEPFYHSFPLHNNGGGRTSSSGGASDGSDAPAAPLERRFPRTPPPPRTTAPPPRREPAVPSCAVSLAAQAATLELCGVLGVQAALARLRAEAAPLRAASLATAPCPVHRLRDAAHMLGVDLYRMPELDFLADEVL